MRSGKDGESTYLVKIDKVLELMVKGYSDKVKIFPLPD